MQKIAIIGFGFMGGTHAQIYDRLPNAQLTAVVDSNESKAKHALEKLGIRVPVYPTLGTLLEKEPHLDAIDICLATDLHPDHCHQAIQAEKAVFCEKPLALTSAEGATIVRAASEKQLPLQVGQAIRFWPEYQSFQHFVGSNRVGKLLSLTMQRRTGRPGYTDGNWILNAKRSGGAALELHIHDTDFVHHLLGTPTAVSSHGTQDNDGGYNHIFTRYHFPDTIVEAEGGWNYPPKWGFQMAFQAVFEKGAVEFDADHAPTLRATVAEEDPQPLPYEQPKIGSSKSGTGNISSLGGYFNELKYFVGCLESGTQPEIATGEQALRSIQTVEAEIESAKTGKTIPL